MNKRNISNQSTEIENTHFDLDWIDENQSEQI